MANLTYVAPIAIRQHWQMVRKGLEEVLAKGGGTWIPEDVYHYIKSGRAHLHMSDLGGYTSGFVVLEPVEDHDGMSLHIWAAWSKEGDATETHMPELQEYAANINAKRITFSSVRAGWGRYAGKHGFKEQTINYSMESLQ